MGFKRKQTNKRNKKRETKKYRGGMNAAVPAPVTAAPNAAQAKAEAKAKLIQTVPDLKTALDNLDTFDPQTKDHFEPIDKAMGNVNEALLSYKGLFV